MSRNYQLMDERDRQIREYYVKMAAKEINNKQLYRHAAILVMASKKFFLTEKYIERILSGNNESDKEPVNPNQKTIFDEMEEEG